ncbi:phosphoesterase [Spirosoma telluris]|uniref:phosphoesterase n=1 Tax=Spirosoma telluris TaxID=2183553 RepID=UPI0038CD570D
MNIHFTHRKLPTSKTIIKHNYRGLLTTLLLIAFLQGCRKQSTDDVIPTLTTGKAADQYTGDVATTWAALQLKLTKTTPGFSPPVASRAFGYAGITMYESVVPGIAHRKSLVGQLQGLTALPQAESGKEYNWALSANAAQAQIIRSLYPTTSAANKVIIDSLETVLLTAFKSTDETVNQRSVDFGKKIADALFEWSKTDGGDAGYSRNFPASYVVPTGAGMWQPTENGQKIPMQPYWGKNRTFVKANNDLPMPKPLTYSTDVKSAIFSQYMDVYNKSKSLTQTEKEISLWWSDNPGDSFTPPGHSYSLARIAAVSTKANLAKAAETFARTGISVADAFILCWRCKFTYNNLRPYTYVRLAIDPAWVPFWPAPLFRVIHLAMLPSHRQQQQYLRLYTATTSPLPTIHTLVDPMIPFGILRSRLARLPRLKHRLRSLPIRVSTAIFTPSRTTKQV